MCSIVVLTRRSFATDTLMFSRQSLHVCVLLSHGNLHLNYVCIIFISELQPIERIATLLISFVFDLPSAIIIYK